jgi:hypothetical protein
VGPPDGRAIRFGRADTGGKNADELFGLRNDFIEERGLGHERNTLHEAEPTPRLSKLLVADLKFMHEILPRLGSFGFAVIAVRRRAGSQKLIRNVQTGSRPLHGLRDANDSHRKLQQPLLQIILCRGHLRVER